MSGEELWRIDWKDHFRKFAKEIRRREEKFKASVRGCSGWEGLAVVKKVLCYQLKISDRFCNQKGA